MKRFFTLMLVIYSIVLSAQKPTLIVNIVIDQMRYDYLQQYWNKFSDMGFKRLIDSGTICKNAQYQYLNINSPASYATIASGSYPSQHGIINSSWYNRITNTVDNCVDDKNYTTVGNKSITGKSPKNLSTLTWTDELKINTFKMSKVYSVGLNDFASVLIGGKLANAAYWYDQSTGNWVTSSYYMDSLKTWVRDFNRTKFPDIYLSKNWETSLDINQYIESLPDATDYETGFNGRSTFPYNLPTLRQQFGNYKTLCYTPFANTYTKDFAITLVMNEYLGRDPYTDVLFVNFSATSFIGQIFSPKSVETEDTYIKLDKDIAHLITFIENYVGKNNVVFVLTSDRGSCENSQWLNAINIDAGQYNPDKGLVIVSSYLRAIYGLQDWVSGFYNDQIYLNSFNIDKFKLSQSEMQNKSASILAGLTGINTVIPTNSLSRGTYSSGIMLKAQNSYFEQRSGDIMFELNYGWRFQIDKPDICGCNSSFNENSHVPIIFYGAAIKHQVVYREISMDDLAVTLSFMLDIPLPTKSTGKPISEILTD